MSGKKYKETASKRAPETNGESIQMRSSGRWYRWYSTMLPNLAI